MSDVPPPPLGASRVMTEEERRPGRATVIRIWISPRDNPRARVFESTYHGERYRKQSQEQAEWLKKLCGIMDSRPRGGDIDAAITKE